MSKSTGVKMYRKPPPGIMPRSGQIYGRKQGPDLPYERRFLNVLRRGLSVTRASFGGALTRGFIVRPPTSFQMELVHGAYKSATGLQNERREP